MTPAASVSGFTSATLTRCGYFNVGKIVAKTSCTIRPSAVVRCL